MQQQLPRHIPFIVPAVLHRTEKSVKIRGWRRLNGALEIVDIWLPVGGIDGEREVAGGIELTLWVKLAEKKGLVPSEEHGYTTATIYQVGPIPDARPISEIEQAIREREAERLVLAQKFHAALNDGVLELLDLRSRAGRASSDLHLVGASTEVLIGVVVERMLPVKPLKTELRRAKKVETVQQQLDVRGLPLFEKALERDEDRPEFSAVTSELGVGGSEREQRVAA